MLHRLRLTTKHDLLSTQTRFRQSMTVMDTHLACKYWVGQTHYGPFMTNIHYWVGHGPRGPPYGAPHGLGPRGPLLRVLAHARRAKPGVLSHDIPSRPCRASAARHTLQWGLMRLMQSDFIDIDYLVARRLHWPQNTWPWMTCKMVTLC